MADDLVDYSPPSIPGTLSLDFMTERSLEALEEGIKRMGHATDLLGLVQGCALLKIKNEGLWREAGFSSYYEYHLVQHDRLGLPPATLSNRLKMASAWIYFRKSLSRLKLDGHVAKLVYLENAVDRYGQAKTIDAFKAMSYREFVAWSKGRKKKARGLPDVDLSVRGDVILLDGAPLLSMSEDLPEDERGFIASSLKAVYRARRGNCFAHVVAVYDAGEARAVDRFLRDRRESK